MTNLPVYKFIRFGDYDTRSEIVDGVKIFTEQALRQQFCKMIDSLPKTLIDAYKNDCDFSKPDTIPVGMICEIINDISNYNQVAYYKVVQDTIGIDETVLYRAILERAANLASLEKQANPDKPIQEITKTVVDYITGHKGE